MSTDNDFGLIYPRDVLTNKKLTILQIFTMISVCCIIIVITFNVLFTYEAFKINNKVRSYELEFKDIGKLANEIPEFIKSMNNTFNELQEFVTDIKGIICKYFPGDCPA